MIINTSRYINDNNGKEMLNNLLEEKLIEFDHAYELYNEIVIQPFDIYQFSIAVQLVYCSVKNAKDVALEIFALGYNSGILDAQIQYIDNVLNEIRAKLKVLAEKHRYECHSKEHETMLYLGKLLSPSCYHETKNKIIN